MNIEIKRRIKTTTILEQGAEGVRLSDTDWPLTDFVACDAACAVAAS
jgi:hypothetical protein